MRKRKGSDVGVFVCNKCRLEQCCEWIESWWIIRVFGGFGVMMSRTIKRGVGKGCNDGGLRN